MVAEGDIWLRAEGEGRTNDWLVGWFGGGKQLDYDTQRK